jgi:hypothetical protein
MDFFFSNNDATQIQVSDNWDDVRGSLQMVGKGLENKPTLFK